LVNSNKGKDNPLSQTFLLRAKDPNGLLNSYKTQNLFLKNDDSNLIGRPNSNILGFNLYYNNKYEKLLPATPHFSLDLNNAEIYCFDSKNKPIKFNV